RTPSKIAFTPHPFRLHTEPPARPDDKLRFGFAQKRFPACFHRRRERIPFARSCILAPLNKLIRAVAQFLGLLLREFPAVISTLPQVFPRLFARLWSK